MRILLHTALIICTCQFANPVFAGDENVLEQMFAWFNQAIKDPNGFTEEAFRRYYTEDAAIVINSKERVRGIKPLVAHFKKIQQKVEMVEIILPFEEGFQSGNRIFTYHKERSRTKGVESRSEVMGYAIV